MPRPPKFSEAFIGYHYPLSAIATAAYALVVHLTKQHLLAALPPPIRTSLYTSLTATSGVLLGFAITAVTVLLSLGPGRGLNLLRAQAEFKYTRKVLMGAIYFFAYATAIATILILADERQTARPWLETVGVFIYIVAALRTWSLVWLLNRLVKLAVADAGTTAMPSSQVSG